MFNNNKSGKAIDIAYRHILSYYILMKSITSKIKKDALKSKEEIDSLIADMSDLEKNPTPFVPVRAQSTALVDDKFYLGNLFPMIESYLPEDMQLTEKEKVQLTKGVQRKLTGLSANMPIKCYGESCPFIDECPFQKIGKVPEGRSCHFPEEKILTTKHGEIEIKDLDDSLHKLPSYYRRRNSICGDEKRGYSFKKSTKEYVGNLVSLTTEKNKTNKITPEHISIARFNENAVNRFCVYLMKRGNYFRVGKSVLVREGNDVYSKRNMPFIQRMNQEDADCIWILETFSTNAQALLGEEYYSCFFNAPKACFLVGEDGRNFSRKKEDGLYKWITQEELNKHHQRFLKPTCYWAKMLEQVGLSYDYPIATKENNERTYDEIKVYARRSMFIRAANLLPEVMDVPVYPEKNELKISEDGNHKYVNWEQISKIELEKYSGIVYALDVERHKTYFANKIATHNCPVESMMLDLTTKRYLDEFEVDSNDFSEVTTMSMLAATHIMEMRGFAAIGRDETNGSPDGIIKNVVGYDADEEPITQYQEHPGYNIIERAWRWRTKLLESLGATRKEKSKLGDADGDLVKSLSEANARLRSKIDSLTTIDIS